MFFAFPKAHFGPGSTLGSGRDLASHDYHHAVVIDSRVDVHDSLLMLTVLPMPAYSAIDPISGLSSTSWLLSQPADYRKLHIPVPHEHTPLVPQPHPPFPTPAQFGDPVEFGGWKDRRPSWIQAVPMLIHLTFTTNVRIEFFWRQVSADQHSDIAPVLQTSRTNKPG